MIVALIAALSDARTKALSFFSSKTKTRANAQLGEAKLQHIGSQALRALGAEVDAVLAKAQAALALEEPGLVTVVLSRMAAAAVLEAQHDTLSHAMHDGLVLEKDIEHHLGLVQRGIHALHNDMATVMGAWRESFLRRLPCTGQAFWERQRERLPCIG